MITNTTNLRKNLIDIYVFVNGASRASAEDLVSCLENDAEVEKSIAIYMAPFHGRRHSINVRVPFISALAEEPS